MVLCRYLLYELQAKESAFDAKDSVKPWVNAEIVVMQVHHARVCANEGNLN